MLYYYDASDNTNWFLRLICLTSFLDICLYQSISDLQLRLSDIKTQEWQKAGFKGLLEREKYIGCEKLQTWTEGEPTKDAFYLENKSLSVAEDEYHFFRICKQCYNIHVKHIPKRLKKRMNIEYISRKHKMYHFWLHLQYSLIVVSKLIMKLQHTLLVYKDCIND